MTRFVRRHLLNISCANAFAEEKITYIEDTGQVLYRSDMTHGKNKKNSELLPSEAFIARVTQYIPEKGFQMVRYYGWYSNKAKGQRRKEGMLQIRRQFARKRGQQGFHHTGHI